MKNVMINYRKPTPPKWRKIGDACLLLALVVEPLVQSMPLQDENAKAWMTWGFSAVLIVLKFWTNTRTEGVAENKPTDGHLC